MILFCKAEILPGSTQHWKANVKAGHKAFPLLDGKNTPSEVYFDHWVTALPCLHNHKMYALAKINLTRSAPLA